MTKVRKPSNPAKTDWYCPLCNAPWKTWDEYETEYMCSTIVSTGLVGTPENEVAHVGCSK